MDKDKLTKLTYTAYKKDGGFLETRTYDCKVNVFETIELINYLYKKHPKLRKMQFTLEAWQDGGFNGRLILNTES